MTVAELVAAALLEVRTDSESTAADLTPAGLTVVDLAEVIVAVISFFDPSPFVFVTLVAAPEAELAALGVLFLVTDYPTVVAALDWKRWY